METKVNPEWIRLGSQQLRGMSISDARARELATEAGRVINAALGAAERTDFNEEPSRILAVLSLFPPPPN